MANKRKDKHLRRPNTENLPARDASMILLSSSPLTPSPPPERLSMLHSRARFLIASIGNPGDLANTRHSAGHILLRSLASSLQASVPERLGTVFSSPSFPHYSFFQCPTLMNISGPPVIKTYRQFIHKERAEKNNTIVGLFVLHDDLETKPGKLKIRWGQTSASGHNGVKSVLTSMRSIAGLKDEGIGIVRVGIGIGRPIGRMSDEVVPYVMTEVSHEEREAIESCAGEVQKLLDEAVRKTEEER